MYLIYSLTYIYEYEKYFGRSGGFLFMDKQTVIQNILTNYGKYGITADTIIPLIDSGVKQQGM